MICDRGFPARIAHAHNLRTCARGNSWSASVIHTARVRGEETSRLRSSVGPMRECIASRTLRVYSLTVFESHTSQKTY